MKSNLVVASIALSVFASLSFASALQAAEKPKPWAKKFTMTKQECMQRRAKFKQEHGMHPAGWSLITNVHDYDSFKPSFVSKCVDRYGHY